MKKFFQKFLRLFFLVREILFFILYQLYILHLFEINRQVETLKVKTNTCKRVFKELHSYEEEVEREAAKMAGMDERGADPYDLKQQVGFETLDLDKFS